MSLPDLFAERRRFLTRRWFFRDCGVGLGAVALNSLLAQDTAGMNPAARHDPGRRFAVPRTRSVGGLVR